MTNEQILKLAIEKAVKNGYKIIDGWSISPACLIVWFETNNATEPYSIIFSHDFANAFWGKEDKWHTTKCTCGGADFHLGGYDMHYAKCDKLKADRGYKFHLGKMVLKKNPIKYLEKFI